jgi:hypothetical protein
MNLSEKQFLLMDCCGGSDFQLQLIEGSSNKGRLVKFRGKFQEAEAINKNKRMYPYDVLNENVQKLQESIKNRTLLGELDHPSDSVIHFANASHIVTKLWWDGNSLMGEGEILNTPHGKVLQALIEDGVRIGISSRGVGNGKVNEDGILVIGESYKLITFDAVADPSTFEAFQDEVVSKDESVKPTAKPFGSRRNNPTTAVKNEGTRIDTLNKELLIAYLGGFVNSHADKLKSRLK